MTTQADGLVGASVAGRWAPGAVEAQGGSAVEPPGPPPVLRTAAAARRSNRKLLVLGVLVVLLGGVLALAAGRVLTKRTEVLAVVRAVPVGATVSAADLAVADVTSDPHLSPVPAAELPRVVGQVAQTDLVAGQLLARAQVGPASGFRKGELLVALACKAGQLPVRGLRAGDRVVVVATAGAGSAGGPGAVPGATVTSTPLVMVTVTEVGERDPSSQVTVVDVRAAAGDAPGLASLSSTGNLALVLLPAEG